MSERLIHVKVQPETRKESFVEKRSDIFHVTVREEAKRNAANKRVRELVAHHFKVSLQAVSIRAGHYSRNKMIRIIHSVK